ncbi:HAMP domain-containing sensor histidine kinase [Flavobacterium sp. 20NA77.7]|uniref:histidine kinase n=1 Tax=Flavobacterium nakdongensis TaxID=3073563 RepID=A0ABY9R982_9FLAO|nr:HAMP domain-containing sensor histidine kinase [Flavobacterium sp. 20NA77.7]WMW77808.1 HAMP domain-containing sensor histidine kinase [Flavobacterium sp. 20NA77.7]
MKFSRLNSVIIIGLLAIVGVIIMQLLLIDNAYKLEKKETEDKIFFALQDVLDKVYRDNHSGLTVSNQVIKQSEEYYIVNVNDEFENTILEHYLKEEFQKIKLDLAFEYAVYNCSSNQMVYGSYISSKGEKEPLKCKNCFVKHQDYTYYFAIHFPEMKQSHFKNLEQYWVFTGVLLFVLIIYVYSILLMLKQKKYTDLQKDFINNMTHEFKTPLSSILIASTYCKDQPEIKTNSKLARYNQIIIEQSQKLNQHIERILYVAKTESKQMTIEKTPLKLLPIIELVKENVLLKFEKELTISIVSQNEYQIQADAFHFYNVIYNLVDNAVKYSGERPNIQLLVSEENSKLTLKIIDNGMGIPERELPFVFDKFYRVAREDSKEIEGFGIGLAYVKKICEMHHWQISIHNNQKEGITVTIIIHEYKLMNNK